MSKMEGYRKKWMQLTHIMKAKDYYAINGTQNVLFGRQKKWRDQLLEVPETGK
jgi:hypothetical protein